MGGEILQPQIIMATDEKGQSTPMACGIMLVKAYRGDLAPAYLKYYMTLVDQNL